jgi:uncharacterized protein (DUF433 family)
LPAYGLGDAARYANAYPQTVAYWHYKGGGLGPALPGKTRRTPLSYLELVEVAFVAVFRRLGVSLQRIRKAREYVAQNLGSEYPFAEYRFKTEGYHVLLDLQHSEAGSGIKKLILADAGGQLGWEPVVADRFAQFDYERDLAMVWHLAGRQSEVTIDPRISFGAPTVGGLPTWVLKGRWRAGESLEDIQEDFGLSYRDVVEGLRFEGIQTAA